MAATRLPTPDHGDGQNGSPPTSSARQGGEGDTLLIDDDTRHRSYCLLLLTRVDVDESELRDKATKYGREDEIDVLLRYLRTHGDVEDGRLPEWSEFQEVAADYEVSLPP